MSEIELKPCPFCGGEAVIHVSDGVAVICRECGAASKCLVDGHLQGKPDGRAIKSVIKAWNTRKPMERIVERLENKMDHSFNQRRKAFAEAVMIVRKGGAE